MIRSDVRFRKQFSSMDVTRGLFERSLGTDIEVILFFALVKISLSDGNESKMPCCLPNKIIPARARIRTAQSGVKFTIALPRRPVRNYM